MLIGGLPRRLQVPPLARSTASLGASTVCAHDPRQWRPARRTFRRHWRRDERRGSTVVPMAASSAESPIETIWEIPLNSRSGAASDRGGEHRRLPTDRVGSFDGIVRRANEDAQPGPKDDLMWVRACPLEYRIRWSRSWRSQADQARCRAVEQGRRRGPGRSAPNHTGQGRRPDHRHVSPALV